MAEPLISVVIPAYNRASIILSSINSVLNQTYKNIELIVVDDASIDNTADIVKAVTDPRCRYVRLDKNSGACVARNKGIDEAHGEYIAFNDSDDQWHSDKIEQQLAAIAKRKADILLCRMACYNEKTEKPLHYFPEGVEPGYISYEKLIEYNCASTQTLFGKADCFKKIKFDPEMPRLQDWDEVLRLSQKYNVFYINEVLVDTYIQSDSISTHPEKGVAAMEKLYIKNKDIFLKYPELAVSFFSKKAAFVCRCSKNPVDEMKQILKVYPCTSSRFKYFLARTGLYLPLFNLKHK